MNLSYVYENRHLLPEEAVQRFEANRKANINTVEHIGLEAILCLFVEQYELENFGETNVKLSDYTRWTESGVDILDGCYDTYIFDNYAISEIWMTDNDCILLDCYDLTHPDYDDPFDVVDNIDWHCECKPVTFRLD